MSAGGRSKPPTCGAGARKTVWLSPNWIEAPFRLWRVASRSSLENTAQLPEGLVRRVCLQSGCGASNHFDLTCHVLFFLPPVEYSSHCRISAERMSSSASPAETAGTTASVSDAPPSTIPEKQTSAPSQASGGAAASTGVATRRAAR